MKELSLTERKARRSMDKIVHEIHSITLRRTDITQFPLSTKCL